MKVIWNGKQDIQTEAKPYYHTFCRKGIVYTHNVLRASEVERLGKIVFRNEG